MSNCKVALIVGAIVGVVLVIVAAVLGFKVLPDVVHDSIDEQVILDKKGTEQYARFEELPFAMNFSIYFFNVTNPNEVMLGTEKPNVQEVGPIVYKKFHKKVDIVFNDDDKTITYLQNKTHEFAEEYSDVERNTTITVINTPLVSVMQIFENLNVAYLNDILVKGYPKAFGMPANTVFHDIELTEYMFDGYKFCDPAVFKATDAAAKFVCACIRLLGPETMEVEDTRRISFSFFKHKDNNPDGPFVVDQGVNDIRKVGSILEWRGSNKTTFWHDTEESQCNDVRGTDTTIYPPHNDETNTFLVFNTDICRTVELAFTEEMEYEGIPGHRSELIQDNLDWSINPCYCLNRTRNLEGEKGCPPNGFTDLYSCLDAPILLSLPHFLWGDELYADTVTGLQQNKDDHKIYVDMEPNTGSPLRGFKRVQFNTILRNYKLKVAAFTLLNKVNPAVVPILWIDENVQIPKDLQDVIKTQYLTPVTAIEISKWCLIAIGAAMFACFTGLYIYKRRS